MRKAGYRPETAAAITAAAATIGPIIPPSLPMVIFGVTADVSIGRLFLAGVIPGVLMGLSLMVMVALIAKREGSGLRFDIQLQAAGGKPETVFLRYPGHQR